MFASQLCNLDHLLKDRPPICTNVQKEFFTPDLPFPSPVRLLLYAYAALPKPCSD